MKNYTYGQKMKKSTARCSYNRHFRTLTGNYRYNRFSKNLQKNLKNSSENLLPDAKNRFPLAGLTFKI